MKNKTPAIVTIGVLTLITVIFWIGFSVFRLFSSHPTFEIPSSVLLPIQPTIDTKTLDEIEQSIYFEPGQLVENLPIKEVVTPDVEEEVQLEEILDLPIDDEEETIIQE